MCDTNLNQKGFTLVELMIVVAIIAILGAIAIPAYQGYISSTKQQSARAILEQFPILLESYRAEIGRMCPACNANGAHTYNYSEDDSGVEDTVGNKITTAFPEFKGKGTTSQPSMYDYSVTITVAGCPACTESAQATATPVPSRGAPAGNIVGAPFQ
jgi:prepilin-type N-terminal cleavage/methylation domain-containing protein